MQGVDQASMKCVSSSRPFSSVLDADLLSLSSRTRFMIESLTNLKNNKIKPNADGAVDNYSNLKKYLVGLNKRRASGSFTSLSAF